MVGERPFPRATEGLEEEGFLLESWPSCGQDSGWDLFLLKVFPPFAKGKPQDLLSRLQSETPGLKPGQVLLARPETTHLDLPLPAGCSSLQRPPPPQQLITVRFSPAHGSTGF